MSFDTLLHKVRQAEAAVEAQQRRTSADWRQLKCSWRAIWTPGRLIVAGLLGGYAIGSGKVGATTTSNALRLLASLSAFIASRDASAAAEDAEQAAHSAQDAAGDDVAGQADFARDPAAQPGVRHPTVTAEACEYEP